MDQNDTARQKEKQALAYLREQLGDRAPQKVQLEGVFDEQPLEGDARTYLFSFRLDTPATCEAPAQDKHYVAVRQAEPNYFPAYGMNPSEAYSFHIGTRFMLEMGIQIVDASLEPPGARAALREFVARYARGATVRNEQLAALFRCDEAYFAVYRLTLHNQDVYCLGADCPPGFYRCTQYPPQMVLRLHLGNVIRAEARAERTRRPR